MIPSSCSPHFLSCLPQIVRLPGNLGYYEARKTANCVYCVSTVRSAVKHLVHARCIMQVGLCRFGCCNTSFVSRFLHSIYSQLQRGVHRDVIGGGGCSFTIVRSGPYLFSVVVKLTCLLTQDAMLCVVTQGPSLFRAFSSPRGHVAMSHCQKSNVALFMGTSEEHGQLLLHLDCLHW